MQAETDRGYTQVPTGHKAATTASPHSRPNTPAPTARMRARHVAHAVPAFPVYSAAFLSPSELLLGGGGGSSKSGIKNKLVRRPLGLPLPLPSFAHRRRRGRRDRGCTTSMTSSP